MAGGVLTGVAIGALTINSRSVTGRRDTCSCVGSLVGGVEADVHGIPGIDPEDLTNISFLLAVEWTQASPQSSCVKDFARENISSMRVTLETSHFEMSPLNAAVL